ncbi:MAG: DUF424 domain-containing protein, partial [Thermoprotei archaeon]
IVAICDEDLLGKVLEEKGVRFEVKEDFYRGELVDVERALELVETGTIVNLVGETIVSALAERNDVVKLAVVEIAGVPHVQLIT